MIKPHNIENEKETSLANTSVTLFGVECKVTIYDTTINEKLAVVPLKIQQKFTNEFIKDTPSEVLGNQLKELLKKIEQEATQVNLFSKTLDRIKSTFK